MQRHSLVKKQNLQQKLILHDPLNRLDEQVVELQPVTQLLPEILSGKKRQRENVQFINLKKSSKRINLLWCKSIVTSK